MTSFTPLIGIPSFFDETNTQIKRAYADSIYKAGGLVVVIPYSTEKSIISDVVARVDGILIPGGPDVDPSLYGEEPIPQIGAFNILHDRFYIFVIEAAIAQHIPIFGICRGLQILNVYFGGSLIQDIEMYRKTHPQKQKDQLNPDDPSNTGIKHLQNGLRFTPSHSVTIDKDSNIYKLLGGKDKVRVNSLHHQAIKVLSPQLKVTSRAPDGIIESVEKVDDPTIFAVQWHPEEVTSHGVDDFINFFKYLVDEARKVCQNRNT